MNFNTKSYIKYRFKTVLNPKMLKKPILWIFLTIILTDFILWKPILSNTKKSIIFIISLLIILFLNELVEYKSGEWKRWQRDQLGIPSKKQIKKMKEGKMSEEETEQVEATSEETEESEEETEDDEAEAETEDEEE